MFQVNEDEQDDLKVQESGDPKGPPALRRSEKEVGRRPPEPSRKIKELYLLALHGALAIIAFSYSLLLLSY